MTERFKDEILLPLVRLSMGFNVKVIMNQQLGLSVYKFSAVDKYLDD